MVSWRKWAWKGTFELILGFGGSGCAKGLLGKIGVLGEMATFRLKTGFGRKMGMQKDFWVKLLLSLSCFENKYICFNHLKMKTKAHYQ